MSEIQETSPILEQLSAQDRVAIIARTLEIWQRGEILPGEEDYAWAVQELRIFLDKLNEPLDPKYIGV